MYELSLLMYIPGDDNKNAEYSGNEADSEKSELYAGLKDTPLKLIKKTINGIVPLNK